MITDTDLLNLVIKEMDHQEWMKFFPLFRPMEKDAEGNLQYSETYIDPKTFREHLRAAHLRWEK